MYDVRKYKSLLIFNYHKFTKPLCAGNCGWRYHHYSRYSRQSAGCRAWWMVFKTPSYTPRRFSCLYILMQASA